MNEKTEIMVALSAAIGANCIPCFESLYEKAKCLGLEDQEILRIAETANKVKTGASIFIKNTINETMGLQPEKNTQPCCAGTERTCC